MKTLVIQILSLTIILSTALYAAPGPFEIEVYVGADEDDDVQVYGLFSADENEYGGIELVFYKDIYSYSIRAIENVSDLVGSPMVKDVKTDDKNVLQIVHIFLKPIVIADGRIRLTGNWTTMVNTADKGEPLFRMVEKPLVLTMEGDDQKLVTVDPGKPGRLVDLKLVLRVEEDLKQSARSSDSRFSASYSLFNKDDDRFEVKDEPCQLTFGPGDDGDNGLCRHSRTYALDNGDSLLYIVDYDIDGVKNLADRLVNFTIAVKRFFFENPSSFFSSTDEDIATGNKNYGDAPRSVDCVVSINGKDRRVRAKIDRGTITDFRWDNIRLTPRDILRNWNDIVGLLKKIETTGDYDYRRPVLDEPGDTGQATQLTGLLASPDNYTADKMTATTYSKSITIKHWETTEIEIPFTKSHRLPFDGYEIIRIKKLD